MPKQIRESFIFQNEINLKIVQIHCLSAAHQTVNKAIINQGA